MKKRHGKFSALLLVLLSSAGCEEESEGPEGMVAGECSDDADNDGNGLFDCSDPGCEGAPSCGGGGASGGADEGGADEGGAGEGGADEGGADEGGADEGGSEDGDDVACGPQFDPGGQSCGDTPAACAVGCFCGDAGVLADFCNNGVCRSAAESCSLACEGFGGWPGEFGCDPAA